MQFEWDQNKAKTNFQKHSVHFRDATRVFLDNNAITDYDQYPDEDRYVTMGMDLFGRILVIVYTQRGDKIRIISARRANKLERQRYLEES